VPHLHPPVYQTNKMSHSSGEVHNECKRTEKMFLSSELASHTCTATNTYTINTIHIQLTLSFARPKQQQQLVDDNQYNIVVNTFFIIIYIPTT
jgi:hypothetical protein